MNLTETHTLNGLIRCLCIALWSLCHQGLVAQVTNEVQTGDATNAPVVVEPKLETIPSTSSTNLLNPIDFKSYAIVISRNIFSPTKSIPSTRSEVKKAPQVDIISLVGTMSSDKGQLAFFDGTASAFRSVVKLTNVIAGLTLSVITPEQVTLTSNGQTFLLRVGNQLRREDQGEWKATEETLPTASASFSSGGSLSEKTSTVSSSGEDSDVLKRLLQKREQDLNNEKR